MDYNSGIIPKDKAMKNVIVVEDDKITQNALLREFKSYPTLNALFAESYVQATKILRENHKNINFAILDLTLPDASADKIVALFNSHHIPSLILTGTLSSKLRDEVFKKEIIDYVIKTNSKSISYAVKRVYSFLKHHKMSILIADDSKLYRQKIKHALRHLNIKIFEADDGLKALDIIENRDNNISVLITDYNMPNMDGLELSIKIRSLYTKDDFSIIAISTVEDRETIKNFIKVGANDFIIKPFSDDEVLVKANSSIEILELFEKTRDLANRDFLTGAFNRRHFFDAGNAILAKAIRKKHTLAVATLDIDDFKKINDTYGHDVGDIAIKEMARIVKENLRESDLSARFGGEEFCVLLDDINLSDSKKLFNKICKAFQDNIIQTDDVNISYTVSIGVSFALAKESLDEMIKLSDRALYDAKEAGKNRVVIHTH